MGMLRPGTERLQSQFHCDELSIWALIQQPRVTATITELLPSRGPRSERRVTLMGWGQHLVAAEGLGSEAGGMPGKLSAHLWCSLFL